MLWQKKWSIIEHINFFRNQVFFIDERSFNWFVSNNYETIVGHKNVKNN